MDKVIDQLIDHINNSMPIQVDRDYAIFLLKQIINKELIMMTKYNCPSYYNDNNELVDCTCGECGLNNTKSCTLDKHTDIDVGESDIDEQLDAILEDVRHAHYHAEYHAGKTQVEINLQIKEHVEKCKQQLKKLIIEAKIEEGALFVKKLQNSADTIPPNLLLNEAVNIKYQRIKELESL